MFRALTVFVVFAVPFTANASFANRSVGLGLGGSRVFSDDASWPDGTVVLTLEYSTYLDAGFDWFVRAPIGLGPARFGVGPGQGAGLLPLTGLELGVRYLFLEEAVRPFVFVQLGTLVMFKSLSPLDAMVAAGPGAGAGLEFFVADSVSVQARGFFDWFIGLNAPQRFNVGGTLSVSTFF